MTAHFTLLPDAVATISAESKHAALEQLARRLADSYQLDAATVLERIEERESLGSTGFGRGVAIPHARIPGINRPVAAFLRLSKPIEFASADSLPVDIVFGLLSPENAGASHLHALAAISRLMRDETMHAALSEAPDAEAIFGLLSNVIDRDAA